MPFTRLPAWRIAFGLCAACLSVSAFGATTNQVVVLEKEGQVEAARANETGWLTAQTNQVLHVADRIRTGERSRATLHLLDLSTMRMAELTEFLIEPLPDAPDKPSFNLGKGLLYFFHRDKPTDVQFKTRTATAAIRGTEFHLAVADNGRTVITMFDGEVKLSNEFGAVELGDGEQGVVDPGQAPVKSPALDAISTIQWCLYYPGVLEVDELRLDANETSTLQSSLAAYRAGDLRSALMEYPTGRQPASEAERTYLAALLLSVGKVDEAGPLLTNDSALPAALRALISTVKKIPGTNTTLISTNTATEAFVRSYQLQAQSRLPEALDAAQQSVALAPQFGFGWARVAELEFSFGHTKQAMAALDRSLALAPRNAQAVAMRGFALAAQNRIREATAEFERAIALDGALGNAWLGRGLCRIRRGQLAEGRADLQVAATLEPNRALLRSYLAKAWTELGQTTRAEREIALAKERDENDPTAWLYSALLLQQENRINEAVDDLEHSQDLNDNRRLYRSRLLLDQDRAVRGANLANIYRDAGMSDVSIREAATAVNADYANYSAHLFLANSYSELLDPQRANLRYETPYVSEYLVANLLAPASSGALSPILSQQEYSRLFERNGFGLSSSTEYFSHGNWRQLAAQQINAGPTSFAVEESYNTQHGYRPNSDLEETIIGVRLKHELTPSDSVYLEASFSDSKGGNLLQYYDQSAAANDPIRFKEDQTPIVLAGYHHEWGPGVHTLVLASRLADNYSSTNSLQDSFLLFKDAGGTLLGAFPFEAHASYHSRMEIYTGEAQQIFQGDHFTSIFGGRIQDGGFDNHNLQENFRLDLLDLFPNPVIADQDQSSRFQRFGGYFYEQWHPSKTFQLTAGLSFEHLVIPVNNRFAPLVSRTEDSDHLLPKAGLIWIPREDTTLRAGYAQSLGGATFDQSFQLEPSQVAGFNQSFRSLIPESVAGVNPGATFTIYGLSLEHKFPTRTYAALTGDILESAVERHAGSFDFFDLVGPTVGTFSEHLNFREQSVTASLHQLVGRQWAFGANYRFSYATLKDDFPEVTDLVSTFGFAPHSRIEGTIQTLNLHAIWQCESGWFARVDGNWTHQDNDGYQPARPIEDFWQWDAQAGYRFPRRKVEFRVGVLNLTDANYRLSPLNLRTDTFRDRTFFTQLNFQF